MVAYIHQIVDDYLHTYVSDAVCGKCADGVWIRFSSNKD